MTNNDKQPYLIFVIFSPHIKFWAKFFSTQNPVHRDKTNVRQSSVNCKKHLFSEQIWNFSTCGVISEFPTWQMWKNIRFIHTCHEYKNEISPHDRFFSTYPICDICDKYQVWHYNTDTLTHTLSQVTARRCHLNGPRLLNLKLEFSLLFKWKFKNQKYPFVPLAMFHRWFGIRCIHHLV